MSVIEVRDLVIVEGADAAKYLQGQLSQDIAALAVGASGWSFLLEPSGKLGFVLRVQRTADDRYVLDVEAGRGEAVVSRLRRFLIRTKASLAQATASVDVDPIPSDGATASADLVGWWGTGRHRLVEPSDDKQPAGSDDTVVAALRIAAGWPGAAELSEGLIPAETGLVPLAVNFKKGCYTGQELVARVDSRGNHAPHHLERVLLSAPAAAGAAVIVDGGEAGTLTSVAGLQALSYIRRSVEAPADALVDGHPAQVVSQRA
jgi:tRNA-modifying protein YgfZ